MKRRPAWSGRSPDSVPTPRSFLPPMPWMDKNYSLEPDELARGFVLSCQSHPVSDRVVISYDERL
jgi:hypothetical protein